VTDLSDFQLRLRETVTIIRPMPSTVPRGNNSPRDQQPTTSIRLQPDVLEAVNEAARLLGMSRSALMSWCSYFVALDIIRQYQEYEQSKQ